MKFADFHLPRAFQSPFSADNRDLPYWSTSERIEPWLMLLGLGICSFIPAAFWCGLIWIVGQTIGVVPSATTLLAVGSSIAAFLTIMTSVLLSNA